MLLIGNRDIYKNISMTWTIPDKTIYLCSDLPEEYKLLKKGFGLIMLQFAILNYVARHIYIAFYCQFGVNYPKNVYNILTNSRAGHSISLIILLLI